MAYEPLHFVLYSLYHTAKYGLRGGVADAVEGAFNFLVRRVEQGEMGCMLVKGEKAQA